MNKNILLPMVLLLLLLPSSFSNIVEGGSNVHTSSSIVNYYEKGFRYNIQGWVYIHIEGEPYDRGYQYGFLASAEIVDTINRWSNFAHNLDFMKLFIIKNLPKNYDKLSEQWWKICRISAMNIFLKEVPEEYKQEMKGMVDGVRDRGEKVHGRDIEFEDIVASHFVQESLYNIKFSEYRYHPFRGIFSFSKPRQILSSLLKSILQADKIPTDTRHHGHCSAFIATGDATSDGGIVVAHSTFFNPMIAERCNIILDVQPTQGYRFVMSCVPGSMWSQEDFYLNDQGIIITETEMPQGPWKRTGTPKGVRSRRAIQYSDSIDDVIDILMDGNNGLIPNEWLIGDTKTGEIASMEQALFNTPIKRTTNGFYYSFTAPNNKKVQRELFGIMSFIPSISKKYYDGWAIGRDKKFKEIEEQYYGQIDEEIAKKILSTHPINKDTTDGKITSSKLIKDMGLLAFIGNPDGTTWKPTDKNKNIYHGVTELPASGWVELYASTSKHNKLHKNVDYNDVKKTGKVLWKYEGNESKNIDFSSYVISGDIVYTSISSDRIYALDAGKGKQIWTQRIGDKIVNHEVSKNLVVIGTDRGVYAINKETGSVEWHQNVGEAHSKPVIVDNLVITSFSNGDLFAFDFNTGDIKWKYKLPYSGTVSEVYQDVICIGSGNTCYCVNINDRETLWKFETSGKITAPPRIEKNSVYFGSWDGNVYALDLSTGYLKWTFKTGWGIDTKPEVANGLVFVGSNDNNFYALDEKNGDLVWFFTCKSAIHSSPVAFGEYVFFGSDDGRVYALDKSNGELAWTYAPGYSINNGDVNNYITTPIISDPFVKDGVLYIGAKGNIYALDAQTTETPKENISEKSDNDLISLIIFLLLFLLGITLLVRVYLKSKNNKEK